jgi:hypothetical protein
MLGPSDDHRDRAGHDGAAEHPSFKGGEPADFQGSLLCQEQSVEGTKPVPFFGTFDDLVDVYRNFSETAFESKDESAAWSPSYYVANNGTETKRGYENIAFIRNVILDFDGGDLTPEQFVAFFPAGAGDS